MSSVPLEQRPMLMTAIHRLAQEFEGVFGAETIELFLLTSYDQFADNEVAAFRPLLAERFARQRLSGLTKVEGKAGGGAPTVLFLCVHNAGWSQMALGWFNHLAGDRAVAWSGGSEPGVEVNTAAIAAMAEIGIDISGEFRRLLPPVPRASATRIGCWKTHWQGRRGGAARARRDRPAGARAARQPRCGYLLRRLSTRRRMRLVVIGRSDAG